MKNLSYSTLLVAVTMLTTSCLDTACPDMEFEAIYSANRIQAILRREGHLDGPLIREIKNSEEIRDLADFAVQHKSDWERDIYGDARYPEEWTYFTFYKENEPLGGFGLVSGDRQLIAESHCFGSFPRYRGVSRDAHNRLKKFIEN